MGAVFGLIAGVGSVSAGELSVADTANDTGTPFAMLDGIATEQMSVQELAETRGAAETINPPVYSSMLSQNTVIVNIREEICFIC